MDQIYSVWHTDYAQKPAFSLDNEQTLHFYVAYPSTTFCPERHARYTASTTSSAW